MAGSVARVGDVDGGTAKGGFSVADDLPRDVGAHRASLLAACETSDPRQIDGASAAGMIETKVATAIRG